MEGHGEVSAVRNLTFRPPGKVRAVAILHHHGVLGLGPFVRGS